MTMKNTGRCDSNRQLRKQNGSLKSFNAQLKSGSETFQQSCFRKFLIAISLLKQVNTVSESCLCAIWFGKCFLNTNKQKTGHSTLLLHDLNLYNLPCFSKERYWLSYEDSVESTLQITSCLWNLTDKKYEVLQLPWLGIYIADNRDASQEN